LKSVLRLMTGLKVVLLPLALLCLFAVVILQEEDSSAIFNFVVLILLIMSYLSAILVHEFFHYLFARIWSDELTINWGKRPEVRAAGLTLGQAKIVAVAGPLAGAVSSFTILIFLQNYLILTPLYYSVIFCVVCSHLGMLLPIYPDGSILFSKQGGHS
jgi:hypothetical protein